MKSAYVVLVACLGLLLGACDNKPKPGGPVPKAFVSVAAPVPTEG